MKYRGSMIVICALLVALPFASAQTKQPGKGVDACTVLAKPEIETALGLKLSTGAQDPRMQTPGVLSSCDYKTSGGAVISILLRKSMTKYVVGTEKAEFEKQGLKPRYLSGLGTTAFFTNNFGMGLSLSVFRGDYDYISVSAMAVENPEKLSVPIEKLARLVVERWK